MTSSSASVETPKVGGGYKLLGWIVLPLGVIMVLVVLFSHRGLYQMYRFRHERVRLEQENARLAAENARLARTIDRLQRDPILIQDLVRQELNFVKKNEIIFQFPPEKPAGAPDLSANGTSETPPVKADQATSVKKIKSPKSGPPASDGSGKKQANH